jgi:hypothetical protein
MGCFDYTCECAGTSCEHVGKQYQDATVIIEVPLSDGTSVYLKGEYYQSGNVEVSMGDEIIEFHLEEFRKFFDVWFAEDQKKKEYLASRVWTLREDPTDEDRYGDVVNGKVRRECFDGGRVVKLNPIILQRCLTVG